MDNTNQDEKSVSNFFEPSNLKIFFKEALETVVTALILTFIIYYFISTPNQVQGDSMLPNVKPNDLILTNRIEHHLSKTALKGKFNIGYDRGDIVIFKQPGKDAYIKRIVGLPSDEIAICENNLIVNNNIVDEIYIPEENVTFPGTFLRECEVQTIPDDSFAIFGDNRMQSLDSRSEAVAFVRKTYFIGPAFLRLLPLDKIGILKDGEYTEIKIEEGSQIDQKLHYK